MDIVATLQRKIESLGSGDYSPGLEAVLLHIQTAFRHLARGQASGDDTAFTDAIYRTNQAFEGSIKEAFRVLENKDPSRKTPHEIEQKLEKDGLFRKRVLSQFTTYRTEWRNPSTHDYKLDFDEGEAFLAIVSVTAFACLLLDQISERLAFNKSKAETQLKSDKSANPTPTEQNLAKRTKSLLLEFCRSHLPKNTILNSTAQVVGALHGFLAAIAPDLSVQAEATIGGSKNRVDLIISQGGNNVPIEIKRSYREDRAYAAIAQISKYAEDTKSSECILLFIPFDKTEMQVDEIVINNGKTAVFIMRPKI